MPRPRSTQRPALRSRVRAAARRAGCAAAVVLLLGVAEAACSGGDPAEPPYPPSPVIAGIEWHPDTHRTAAPGSDLWPNTWGADGHVYTSWGDGGGFGGTNHDGRVSLGFARIEGPPTAFRGVNVWGGRDALHPARFGGKTAGLVSVDGVLYAWVNRQNREPPDFALAWSEDGAATWRLSAQGLSSAAPVPATFLNFGRDYAGARDGFVYAYGGRWGRHAAIHLFRVPRAAVRDPAAYEVFAGRSETGAPRWSGQLADAEPVFVDPAMGREPNAALKATGIHDPRLGRYLLTASHGGAARLGVFDAPEPWGPWTTVAYYDDWLDAGTDGEALVYGFVGKWLVPDRLDAWMIFSCYGCRSELHDRFNLIRASFVPRRAGEAPVR